MGFGDVRIPATRVGSGIRDAKLPSGREVRGPAHASGLVPRSRMARHVNKGFYMAMWSTDWGDGSGMDSDDIDYLADPGDIQTSNLTYYFMSVMHFNTLSTTTYTLYPPSFLAELLLITVRYTGLGSPTVTYQTSLTTKILSGGSEYRYLDFQQVGDAILLVSVSTGDSYRWSVVVNNGVVLY